MSSCPSPQEILIARLAHVAELHAERLSDPGVGQALERVARWQARRLRRTYEDLAAEPRYIEAIRFFENDLYGNADFGRRDADLARVVPLMVRMLPDRVITTIAEAIELNALSHDLDRGLLRKLPRKDGSFSVGDYCDAYRALGRAEDRSRQIELIGKVGAALDIHVSRPLVRTALAMMKKPAAAMGFGALHDFLERGFHAFRRMHGAQEFLATIVARETRLKEQILSGDRAPFPEPCSHG